MILFEDIRTVLEIDCRDASLITLYLVVIGIVFYKSNEKEICCQKVKNKHVLMDFLVKIINVPNCYKSHHAISLKSIGQF